MIPTIDLLTQDIEETKFYGKTYKIDSMKYIPTSNTNVGSKLGELVLGVSELGSTTVYAEHTVEYETVNRINGFIDEIESVKQAIYLILSTERYKYIIYSWDYGVELVDLIGKPIPYCMAEIPRRIKEALLVDNRIENVTDFQFEHIGKTLHTTFTVVTNVGNVETRLEVDI